MRPPEPARQLVLDLRRDPSYDPDEFLVSPSNADAHATVTDWPDWPDRTLLLVGPPGAGKSHLAAIWAAAAQAATVRPGDALDPDADGAALIEDCDRAGHREADLFHRLNVARERRGAILMTARCVPDLWRVHTPDLLSRLRLAPVVTIGHPDPALIKAVLVKLFGDRQIRIDEDVIAYAARHCDQSLDAVSRFVAAVDEAALVEGRRITRPLAVRTIAALDGR